MKKKKRLFTFHPPSWVTALCLGIGLGIASQHISNLKIDTDHIFESNKYPVSQSSPQVPASVSLGQPVSSFIIHRPNYSLAYDARNRNPAWVYERLTSDSIKGNADRLHSDFKEDENIPKHLRATLSDYRGSGFDRGHMAPAANHHLNAEAMNNTFYMSNMCPQCPQFNRGYWAKVEKHVRDLTKEYKNVDVITGPLYLPHMEADGKRYVKYQVFGLNNVAVPTHFFKIITLVNRQGRKDIRAYILPNQEIALNTPLDNFKTTVEKIERAAGAIFKN